VNKHVTYVTNFSFFQIFNVSTSAFQQQPTNLLGAKDRKTRSHLYWVITPRITAPDDDVAMARIGSSTNHWGVCVERRTKYSKT